MLLDPKQEPNHSNPIKRILRLRLRFLITTPSLVKTSLKIFPLFVLSTLSKNTAKYNSYNILMELLNICWTSPLWVKSWHKNDSLSRALSFQHRLSLVVLCSAIRADVTTNRMECGFRNWFYKNRRRNVDFLVYDVYECWLHWSFS